MLVNATNTAPKTPLDYMAVGYWQDYLTGCSVAGGIAYEEQIQACQLDESLVSLQSLDTLISQIRRDITKSAELNESHILLDERYRNLLLFLAFYSAQVLAKQWGYTPSWYGPIELAKHYPKLPVRDDFYHSMAAIYRPRVEEDADSRLLFFALEPIGQRLFGNIDRRFIALQGETVASGLYQAVNERLPTATLIKTKISSAQPVLSKNHTSIETDSIEKIINNNKADKTAINEIIADQIAEPTSAKVIIEPIQDKPAVIKPVTPTPEIFTQLLTDLNEIEVIQSAGNDDYKKACQVLDQFERHIARQNQVRSAVSFSQTHQNQRQQALLKLQDAANVGHTSAMLRLSMYELLGEGLIKDESVSQEAGVKLIKQAANADDSRAQRLLSRLYYQGLGVAQDIDNGKFWLEQAAKNGHVEAAALVNQWQQAELLITTRQQDQHSSKRYQLLIAIIVVAALLLIIFV